MTNTEKLNSIRGLLNYFDREVDHMMNVSESLNNLEENWENALELIEARRLEILHEIKCIIKEENND